MHIYGIIVCGGCYHVCYQHNVSVFLICYLPTASNYRMELDVCTHVGKEETNSQFTCYEQLHSNQNNETPLPPIVYGPVTFTTDM